MAKKPYIWDGSNWVELSIGMPQLVYSSASPTGPYVGQIWIDTAANSSALDPLEFLTIASASAVYLDKDTASGTYVSKSVFTAKGSLAAASGSATPADLPVGSDNQVLVADSSQTTGVKWEDRPRVETVLRQLPQVDAGEQLLKQAVWWIDSAHSSANGQSVSNLGWGGTALDAQLGSTGTADSNDPKFLDWDGENYIYLPGVINSYLSVPDEAALDITGDIDLRAKVATDAWPPPYSIAIAKRSDLSNPAFSWELAITADAKLRINWYDNGTASQRSIFSEAISHSAGTPLWFRATLDVDNGASGNDADFFTSTDGANWSQVGTTVTTATVATLQTSTSSINIGANINGANNTQPMKIYRAQVFDGINGTKVLDVDTSLIVSGSDTTFPALTGQTVTINRSTSGRKAVCVTHPVWLFGTDDYMQVSDNALLDFGASDDFTVLAVVRQWATPRNNGRWLSKRASGDGGYVLSSNSGYTMTYNAEGDGTDTTTYSSGDFLCVVGVRDAGSSNEIFLNGVSSGSPGSSNGIDLSNTHPLRVGLEGGTSSNIQDFEFIAAAIFRRALTSGEITTLSNYFSGRVS